jgi:hypothetical protein
MAELDDTLGDMSLDDVFGIGEGSTPQGEPAVRQTQETPIVASDEPFLKTASGTVYKTLDDARKGTEHKDQLIQQLRQREIERTGIDPITNQPVRQATAPVNYTQDQDRFLKDLGDAAAKGDTKAYVATQQKLIEDTMNPYASVIAQMARMQAVESVSNEFSDFRDFRKSDDFNKTLDENQPLKVAIQNAETNPAMAHELPEFYKMAYKLNFAERKAPQALRSQPQTHNVRPTVQSTATVPPTSGGVRMAQPSLATSEGRKALIAQFESGGIENSRF